MATSVKISWFWSNDVKIARRPRGIQILKVYGSKPAISANQPGDTIGYVSERVRTSLLHCVGEISELLCCKSNKRTCFYFSLCSILVLSNMLI